MLKKSFVIIAGVLSFSLFAVELTNSDFAKFNNGKLESWRNTNNAKLAVAEKTLTVTAVKGKFEDCVYQGMRIEPSDKVYVFSADVQSDVKAAYLQIKMFKKNKEILRRNSIVAHSGKLSLVVSATHPDADYVEFAMRINRSGAGRDFKFSNLKLALEEDGRIFDTWMRGGKKGFNVTDISAGGFTINVESAEKLHASMLVVRSVSPGNKYLFEADYTADAPRMAYLEVKYCKGNRELKRKQAYGKAAKGKLSLEINTDGCDRLVLQCRVPLVERFVGKKAAFSNLTLKKVK